MFLKRLGACALFCAVLSACPAEPVGGLDATVPSPDAALPAGPDASPDCGCGLTALGECAPETPRGTPEAECPSGTFLADAGFSGRGLCLPATPQGTPEAECPSGRWLSAEGFSGKGLCLPAPPALKDWACPAGWTKAPLFPEDAGGLPEVPAASICTPPIPTACRDGERFSLSAGACTRVGDACPAGDWPDDTELRRRAPGFTGTLRFVKPGAAAPADGTRAAPYATLFEALAAASPGDVVALSVGDFSGTAVATTSVAIVGACAKLTRLTGTPSPALSLRGAGPALVSDLGFSGTGLEVSDRQADTSVSGVRIVGAAGFALRVSGGSGVARFTDVQVVGLSGAGQTATSFAVGVLGAQAVFSGVTIEEVPGASLRVASSGELDAADLVLRDLRPRSLDGDARGLFVGDGATVTLSRAAVQDGVGQALQVAQGGKLTASDLWVSGMRSRADGMLGNGLEVDAAGSATLERAAIVDTREAALVAFDPGSKLTLTDVLVRDTEPAADGSYGMGLWLDDSAALEATRLVVDRPTMAGLGLGKSQVTLTDFVVHDCRAAANLSNGRGVSMELGATVKLSRGVVSYVRDVAVMVHGEAATTHLELEDVTLRDVYKIRTGGQLGTGLVCSENSAVTGRRVLVEHATTEGVRSSGAKADLALQDLVVRDTQPDSTGSFGRGIDLQFGGKGTLSRVFVSASRDVAVAADGAGTSLSLADATIVGTEPQKKSGDFGVAVSAQQSASASLERVFVARAVYGLEANGASGLTLRDVAVSDLSGDGLAIYLQSPVDAKRLLVERVKGTGIITYDGSLRAQDVAVRDVASRTDQTYGWGLQLASTPATLDRLLVERTHDMGLLASGETTVVSASDVVVRDLESEPATGRGGFGLVSQAQARLTLSRVRVERARNVGLLALATGQIAASSVTLLETLDAACGSACKGGGTGAAVFHPGSRLELSDFVIEKSPLIGLQLGAGASLSARRGLLARNLVAMNVLEPDFDFGTGLVQVKVYENGTDLASEVVPVPTIGPLQHTPDAGR